MAKSGYVWDGTTWIPFTAPVASVPNSVATYSSASPISVTVGSIWNDSVNNQLKVWSGSSWIAYAPINNPTFTGAVTVQSGSASVPSISPTGDSNTGIFFPAADTMAFVEGGIEAMRIDSAGRITKPNQPAFYSYRDAGNLTGSNITIVWNQTPLNTGNHYNASTGIFTAPVSGNYLFFCFGMSNATSTSWLEALKNGVRVSGINPYTSGGSTYNSLSMSAIVNLSTNDTFLIRIAQEVAATFYSTGNAHNGFGGYLLG